MAIQMTRQQYEAKYGQKPVVASNGPTKMTRAEYDAKYNKPFTYDVPKIPEQTLSSQEKIAKYNAEQVGYDAEAKKQGGILGTAKNFGKAFVENIAPSETGLGRSIGKIFGNQSNNYTKQIQQTGATQANLVKMIRDKEAKGEDTTKLKQLYNDGVNQLAKLQGGLKEESSMPTTGQVVGQLGGTALDVATAGTYGKAKTALMATGKLAPSASTLTTKLATGAGLPELAKVAGQKASGLFTAKGLGNIAKGTGIGYGYDVSQGLQGLRGEDREGSSAFVPGLGTAIGAGIPLAQGTTQSVKNRLAPDYKVAKLEAKRLKELDKLTQAPLTKAVEKGRQRGIDVKKVLSETDVLHGAVDKTGNITTKGSGGAIEEYTKKYVQGNEDIVSQALKKENKAVPIDLIKARLNKAVMDSGIEGKALTQAKKNIEEELAGYALRGGENNTIPLETLHRAKIDKYNNINFFTEGNVKKYDKTVAKALKEIVENETRSIDVKKVNEELSKHFAVIDYLEKLDGKKVEGGKLGKYFAQTVGGIVGSHFGPLGAIAGAEAGGRLKGAAMSRAFQGKTGKTIPQAEAITQAIEYKKSAPLQLPQSKSNNLGNLNMSQSTTISPTINGIPNTIPPKEGVVKKVINTLTGKDLPNREGGFVRIGKDTKASMSPENFGKKMTFEQKEIANRILNRDTLGTDLATADFKESIGIAKLSDKAQKDFLREAVDIANNTEVTRQVSLPQSQLKRKPLSLPNNSTKTLKYKTTVNIQDKNDLEYLRRILGEDNIKDIQNGKMTNFRGKSYEDLAQVNLISETPKTIEQQLSGKIQDVKLKSNIVYHGTSADNASSIMKSGFKNGSELPENNFRGGGYGKMQNSISFAETPKDASRFSTLSKNGEILESKLKDNAKVVSIKGIEDATDLEDYITYLRKQNIDAVYIGGGEKELVVINPKAVTPVAKKTNKK